MAGIAQVLLLVTTVLYAALALLFSLADGMDRTAILVEMSSSLAFLLAPVIALSISLITVDSLLKRNYATRVLLANIVLSIVLIGLMVLTAKEIERDSHRAGDYAGMMVPLLSGIMSVFKGMFIYEAAIVWLFLVARRSSKAS